jgi:hypothetical protein
MTIRKISRRQKPKNGDVPPCFGFNLKDSDGLLVEAAGIEPLGTEPFVCATCAEYTDWYTELCGARIGEISIAISAVWSFCGFANAPFQAFRIGWILQKSFLAARCAPA